MNASTSTPSPAHDRSSPARSWVMFGAICGLASAVGYTAANVCLRVVTNCDPAWVSCVKSFPTVVLVGPWLLVLAQRRIAVLPPPKSLVILIVVSVFAQLFGNVCFQWSLGIVGIALAVPIMLGTMISSGAVLGRVILNESLTIQMVAAMSLLIVAIIILSMGAGQAYQSVLPNSSTGTVRWLLLAAGVAAAASAGLAYTVLGIVIRHGVTGRVPISTTLVVVGLSGTLGLGLLSWWRIGWDGIVQTNPTDFGVMVLAGLCNVLAFLALTKALQLTSVTFVNALSASQAAMASVAGVMLFREAFTIPMAIGVALTILGLLMMSGRRGKQIATGKITDREA